jgi:hypothetical protein
MNEGALVDTVDVDTHSVLVECGELVGLDNDASVVRGSFVLAGVGNVELVVASSVALKVVVAVEV